MGLPVEPVPVLAGRSGPFAAAAAARVSIRPVTNGLRKSLVRAGICPPERTMGVLPLNSSCVR